MDAGAAEVRGQVSRILRDEGSRVSAGQPVIQIDPGPYGFAAQSAAADLARAQAQLSADEKQLERFDQLLEAGAVDRQTYDNLQARVEGGRAAVQQARAAIGTAQWNLGKSTVRAPFAGTVPLMAGEEANLGFKLLDAAAGARQEAVQAFNAGVQAFNQSQFDAAKAKFLEAVEKAPDMIEPHQGLAEIYYREKDLEAAAAAIERYLAVKPDDTSALTLAYTIHQESGNRERTEQLIDALAETEKAKPLARQIYNQGVAASQRGDDERAVERFRRASSLDPELAAAYSGEATILYNEARYDEAEAALEKLFALDPQNQQGRRMSFLVHDARDDQTKAAEALEAYLAVDKDGAVDLMYQRADMDFRDGNRAKAIAALERILELSPNMARAHYTLGLCHMSADQSKAKQHLERFIELAPEDPEVASAEEMLSYLK